MTEIKIKINHIKKITQSFVNAINNLLVFLSLRKSRKFWGVVYDSVSKQPLDPVIVKLVYAKIGEPVQTCVTDLSGRYGFLAKPGKFKILAKKSNYSFPTNRLNGPDDGIFTDIYRGEFFELLKESEVIGPNIPMDPEKFDWNQKAKLKILNTYPFLKLFFKKLIAVFFWFGFASSTFLVLVKFLQTYNFYISLIYSKIFIAYWALILFNTFFPEPRLWGKVYVKNEPSVSVELELLNAIMPDVVLAKAKSESDGRFLLRANPGQYILQVKFKNFISQLPVTIKKVGVLNLYLKIKLVDK